MFMWLREISYFACTFSRTWLFDVDIIFVTDPDKILLVVYFLSYATTKQKTKKMENGTNITQKVPLKRKSALYADVLSGLRLILLVQLIVIQHCIFCCMNLLKLSYLRMG